MIGATVADKSSASGIDVVDMPSRRLPSAVCALILAARDESFGRRRPPDGVRVRLFPVDESVADDLVTSNLFTSNFPSEINLELYCEPECDACALLENEFTGT